MESFTVKMLSHPALAVRVSEYIPELVQVYLPLGEEKVSQAFIVKTFSLSNFEQLQGMISGFLPVFPPEQILQVS